MISFAPIQKVRIRHAHRGHALPCGGLVEYHEALGMWIRERPEHDSANESTATEVSPGLFLSMRAPYFMSCQRSRIILFSSRRSAVANRVLLVYQLACQFRRAV